MFWKTSIGIETFGQDLRMAVVAKRFRRQRLIVTDTIPGFSTLTDDDKVAALAALVRKYRLAPSRVYLSLPASAGAVRQIEFPSQVGDKVASAIGLQIDALSPWSAEEVYWTYSLTKHVRGAKTIRATVVIAPKSDVDSWVLLLKRAGLPLSGASLAAVTLAHGAQVLWGPSQQTLILSFEGHAVEGALASNGALHAASGTGAEPSAAARMVVDRLLALGRIEDVDGIKLLAQGQPPEDLETDLRAVPLERSTSSAIERFGAVAAALLGLARSPFDANLIPLSQRHRYNRMLFVPTISLAVVALLVGSAWLFRESYQNYKYAEALDAEIRNVMPLVRDVSAQESQLNGLGQRLQVFTAHVRNRDQNLEALRELSRLLPEGTWISSYSYQDGAVTVVGLSQSASPLQKSVEDSALFKEAQWTSSITKDPSGKDRFSLKAGVEARR